MRVVKSSDVPDRAIDCCDRGRTQLLLGFFDLGRGNGEYFQPRTLVPPSQFLERTIAVLAYLVDDFLDIDHQCIVRRQGRALKNGVSLVG
jgi:hypothetical protein